MASDASSSDDPSSGRTADPDRLRALARYDILDTPPSETFDRISDLAAGLFDAPIGLITFVEADRQWHKACIGFDVPELDLDSSFCVHALGDGQRLVVEDATDDERFVDNPLVTGDRHIRFYAGSPMTTPDGHVLGTVCVLDTEPRSPSEQKLERLDHLAQMAVDRLEERRRHKIEVAGTEATLDTTETRLNELVAALDDVVWEARIHPSGPTDADPARSEILYTNSSEERVYGRPTGAFVQDPMLWRSAAHPEDEGDLPTIGTLLDEGQWSGEYRLLRPNGTARWVETSVHVVGRPALPDEPGGTPDAENLERPFKLAGITRDIHRRRQAEASVQVKSEALVEEKTRLRLALQAANAGVFEWSIPEDNRTWDESVLEIFGLDEAPGSTGELLGHVHPDDQADVQEAMGAAIGTPGKRTCQVEYRVPGPDGSNRHVRARGLITRNDEGEAIRMTGFHQDRTEIVERQEELRQNERRFEAIFQDPDLLTGLLDLEGTLRAVNDTALSFVDEGRGDVVGRPFWETPWWDHDASLQEDLREWIERAAGGEYVSYQSEHVTGEGRTLIVRGSIRPVTDEEGTVTSLIVSGRDVTRRVDQRRELETLHEAIEDAADGMAVLTGGEYVYVDQTHVDLYGFDEKEQLLGESWTKLYDENETQRLEETVFPVLQEEGHWQGHVTGSRPDGSTFPAELSLTMTGEDRLVCTVRDMTERRKEERRRELLLAASETGIAEWDVQAGEIHWDETLRNVFGRNPETFEELGELIHPGDRSRVEERLQAVVDDNNSWSGEFRLEDGQGRTRWASTLVIPVRKGDGGTRVLATREDITERKARQRALQRANQRFKQFAEAVPNGFFIVNADYEEMPYVNSAAEALYGVDSDTLRGDPSAWTRHVHPADLPTLQSAMAAQGGGEAEWPQRQEFRVLHPTRGQRWLSVSLHALEDGATGAPERIAGVATDITERKTRERRLQALHQATQSLIDPGTRAEAAKVVVDTLGNALGLEEAAAYLRDGDTLKRVGMAGGGEVGSVPRVEKGHTPLWTALDAGESQVYADPSIIDDGIDRSGIEACAYVPLGDLGALAVGTADQGRLDDEEIQFVETIARSLCKALSELKWERDLTESERRYRTLAENIPNGAVLLFDDRLRYTLAAGELVGAYGLEESDFVGRQAGTVLDIEPDEAEHPLVERYRAALEGERTDRRVEIEDRTLRIHIVPLPGQSEAEGLLLAQDVTEEARRERELRKAKETAEAADEMKSALVANMSHEIRTPLTSILGFAGIIGEEADPEGNVAHFAGLIEKGGQRLMDTLDSVLNLSKLEGQGRTLSTEPVDLSAEARSVADELQPAAEEKGIALRFDAGETPVWARADAGGVGLVARNLAENAIKYTEAGGTVEVRAWAEGDTVTLAVEDTGIGIGEEALAHIFEPFRQESEGLGREYEGVGLGLSIVEQATEQMGGAIEVETEKGEGTTFLVRLPRAETDSTQE